MFFDSADDQLSSTLPEAIATPKIKKGDKRPKTPMRAMGSFQGDFPSLVFLSIQYSSGSESRERPPLGSSARTATRLALLARLAAAPVVVSPLLRSPPLATRPARLVQQPATLLLAATTRLIPPFTVTPRASIFCSSVVRARTL